MTFPCIKKILKLELTNMFINKINIQKSIIFLCISNEKSKNEENSCIYNVIRKNKIFMNKFNKEV